MARYLHLDERGKIDLQFPSMSINVTQASFSAHGLPEISFLCIDTDRITLTPELQTALDGDGAVTDIIDGIYEGGLKVSAAI